jgi:predicted nucleic acid-binding protein
LIDTTGLIDAAFLASITLRHPIYDCLYLIASMQQNAPLVTADAAFVAKVAGTAYAQNVLLLVDWKP